MQEGPSGGRDARGRGPRRRGRPTCRRLRNEAGQFISVVTLFEVMTGGGAPAGTEHCWEGCPGGGGDVLLHGRPGAGRLPPWTLEAFVPTLPAHRTTSPGPHGAPRVLPLPVLRHGVPSPPSGSGSPPHPHTWCPLPVLRLSVPSPVLQLGVPSLLGGVLGCLRPPSLQVPAAQPILRSSPGVPGEQGRPLAGADRPHGARTCLM